jgi:hypothetical protein
MGSCEEEDSELLEEEDSEFLGTMMASAISSNHREAIHVANRIRVRSLLEKGFESFKRLVKNKNLPMKRYF